MNRMPQPGLVDVDSLPHRSMSARSNQLAAPTPLRWIGVAALCAVAVAAVAKLRARARQPKLTPMSDEWLRSHNADREFHH
jgi:hypothetical protein